MGSHFGFGHKMRTLARLRLPSRRAISTVRSSGDADRLENKALAALIRAGRIQDARRLFDSLRNPTTVAYNSMISGHVRRRELPLARNLFDEMPRRDVISYNAMLAGYALSHDKAELSEGRKLFDLMPERDTISWNTMINGYSRNGRMDEAMDLFEKMPVRNFVTWSTVITGFLGTGNVRRAVALFDSMPVKDAASLSALVSGLIRNEKLDLAEEILMRSEVESGGIDAYNTLIAGYGQKGRVKQARRLFDMLDGKLVRNVVSWNSMLMCYVKAGEIKSARALFDEMPRRDLVSWNTMINAYAQVSETGEAELLFCQLPEPDDQSWNSMICGFMKNGEVERAQDFFDRMPCRNLVSWNTMIAGCEQNGNFEGAIEVFAEMRVVGQRPDQHTLSSVLSACAGLASLRQGVQMHQLVAKTILPDTPINNSLITMYSRCGNLLDAKAIFGAMATHRRDFVSWNAMIGGFAHHGLAKDALELFSEMKRMRMTPTYITFISVLNACGYAGLVDEGKRAFKSMVHEFGITPRVEHYASLVDLIGRHGQLEDAMDVVRGMVVEPDRAVWGALLGACKVHNNADLAQVAADALAAIEPESSAPYVLMHNIHADEGRWEEAVGVREVMDRHGIVKQPGFSWIELQSIVHIFVAGDTSHPLAYEILSLLESCNRVSRDCRDIDLYTVKCM